MATNIRERVITPAVLNELLRVAREFPMTDAEVDTLLATGELPRRYAAKLADG